MPAEVEKSDGFQISEALAAKIEKEFMKSHHPPIWDVLMDIFMATLFSFGLFPFVWLFHEIKDIFHPSHNSADLPWLSKQEWFNTIFGGLLGTLTCRLESRVSVGQTVKTDFIGPDGFAPYVMAEVCCRFFHGHDICDKTPPTKKQAEMLRALSGELKQYLESHGDGFVSSYIDPFTRKVITITALKIIEDGWVIWEVKKINNYSGERGAGRRVN